MDVMMRNRFVGGIQDEDLRERLLAKDGLTFDSAYNMALKVEAPRKHLARNCGTTSTRTTRCFCTRQITGRRPLLFAVAVTGGNKAQVKLSWHMLPLNGTDVLLVEPFFNKVWNLEEMNVITCVNK